MERDLKEKKEHLETYVKQYEGRDLTVAFSGGVDSSLLLKLACIQAERCKTNVYAVTIQTMLHPGKETASAVKMAEEMGAKPIVLELDELKEAGIGSNPVDRCYLCKKYMFERICRKSEELGAAAVIDGTNGDDTKEYRPGIRALAELGIQSPLMALGMTKQEVRSLAAEYGISTAAKPSSPCMATRFPYGTKLDYEMIRKAECLEDELKEMGFYNVRARIHDALVRLEVDAEDLEKAVRMKERIVQCTKTLGYTYVTLDLEGFRSGSLDTMMKREEK